MDNYTGVDIEGDGIGGSSHILDSNNADNYPLMEPWSETRTFLIIWDETAYNTTTYCNSTVASLHFNQPGKFIGFNVTGPTGSMSICNVTIPLSLMWGQFSVLVNNVPQPFAIYKNQTHTSIYIAIILKSTKQIKILSTEVVSENLLLPLLLIAVATITLVLKKRKQLN